MESAAAADPTLSLRGPFREGKNFGGHKFLYSPLESVHFFTFEAVECRIVGHLLQQL
jgi:hypothetical protein